MFFKRRQAQPMIRLIYQDAPVYEGPVKDLPLKEAVILEKSMYFFNDPEPCYIHRGAVQVRLTEEILRKAQETPDDLSLLLAYVQAPGIDSFELY